MACRRIDRLGSAIWHRACPRRVHCIHLRFRGLAIGEEGRIGLRSAGEFRCEHFGHGQPARLAISRQSQPAMVRHRPSRIPSGFGLAKSNNPVIAGACSVGNGSKIAGNELSAESSRGDRHASEIMLMNRSLSKFRPLTTAIEARPCSRLGSASKAATDSAPPGSVTKPNSAYNADTAARA